MGSFAQFFFRALWVPPLAGHGGLVLQDSAWVVSGSCCRAPCSTCLRTPNATRTILRPEIIGNRSAPRRLDPKNLSHEVCVPLGRRACALTGRRSLLPGRRPQDPSRDRAVTACVIITAELERAGRAHDSA